MLQSATTFLSALPAVMHGVAAASKDSSAEQPPPTAQQEITSDVLSLILDARPGSLLPLNRADRKRFHTMVQERKERSATLIQRVFRKRDRTRVSMLVGAYKEIKQMKRIEQNVCMHRIITVVLRELQHLQMPMCLFNSAYVLLVPFIIMTYCLQLPMLFPRVGSLNCLVAVRVAIQVADTMFGISLYMIGVYNWFYSKDMSLVYDVLYDISMRDISYANISLLVLTVFIQFMAFKRKHTTIINKPSMQYVRYYSASEHCINQILGR